MQWDWIRQDSYITVSVLNKCKLWCVSESVTLVNKTQLLPAQAWIAILRIQCFCFQPAWGKHMSMWEYIEPRRLYCEWLHCVCGRAAKWSSLQGKGVGLVKSVSWKTNRAVIIFIPVCSCFSKGSGQSCPGLEVARKRERGKRVFLH